MRYQLAPLYCRPWTLNGISARLIESHYENNYGAALNRLNAISEEIERLDLGSAPNPSLARLKRDEIVALNSTLLHELHFFKPRRRRTRRAGRPSRAPSQRTSDRSIVGAGGDRRRRDRLIVDTEEEAVDAVNQLARLDRRKVRERFEESFSAQRMARAYESH